MKTKSNRVVKGIILAAIASIMWGCSGTVLQFISQNQAIPASWFLSTRTLGSGVILLIISLVLYRGKTFSLFKSWKMIGWLVAYALFGLMANLLTFYMAIQTGNAAAATILQYLSPLFIVLGSLFFKKERPLRSDLIAFIVSLVGILLSLTKGDISQLAIPMVSLLWGIGSGITAAGYVVLPRPIVKEHPPIVVLGWGMFISGILFNLHQPIWVNPPVINGTLIASMATVIIVGTILPFGILLYSLNFAPSDVVSIMDAVQPVTTFVLSVIFLSFHMSFLEIVGSVLVIVAIYILQKGRRTLEDETELFIE
ncbi:DMT family transporter [Ligilactobacillus ceti]|uniref:Drug metabolite exporter family protein n=1 Tax=Ligilactobacillus ceti DSM 22408 TaxID=1122146 RepID=A0A0R2KJ24_9LACO|nr:DMT family transporter [Ligilactobacillus ceti]KRN89391.1 drug metabolite exporter family protein [Ligilactobacillus ceti DSM 22408]